MFVQELFPGREGTRRWNGMSPSQNLLSYQRSRSTDSRNGYNSRVSLDLSKKLYVFNIGLGLENSKEGEEKESKTRDKTIMIQKTQHQTVLFLYTNENSSKPHRG